MGGKEGAKPEGQQPPQHQEHKKPQESPARRGGHTPLPDSCHAVACKSKSRLYNFCEEHYEQFKFGLIRKTGEPAADYDKKLGQYTAYRQRTARKAA